MIRCLATLQDIATIQTVLDKLLLEGYISYVEYEIEWQATLDAFGWSDELYMDEIDRAWDYVHSKHYVVRELDENLSECFDASHR